MVHFPVALAEYKLAVRSVPIEIGRDVAVGIAGVIGMVVDGGEAAFGITGGGAFTHSGFYSPFWLAGPWGWGYPFYYPGFGLTVGLPVYYYDYNPVVASRYYDNYDDSTETVAGLAGIGVTTSKEESTPSDTDLTQEEAQLD